MYSTDARNPVPFATGAPSSPEVVPGTPGALDPSIVAPSAVAASAVDPTAIVSSPVDPSAIDPNAVAPIAADPSSPIAADPSSPSAVAARRLRGLHEAMAVLAAVDSVPRLISAVPREACRSLGFDRAMLSHIRGDRLVFASVSFEGNPVLAADFARLARAVRPRLDRCAPEHEAVIRQMPVMVPDVPSAPGVFRPLTHVARTTAYVVAPIVRGGHTVGLLHADVFGTDRTLDELDRELLWTLAAGVGWIMDSFAMRSRSATTLGHDALRLPSAAPVLPAAVPAPPVTGLTEQRLRTLTAREHEVLQLMSEGASNAAIGEALVISHATVKSHVRHILRKLGAANRTEAVSLFLALGRPSQG